MAEQEDKLNRHVDALEAMAAGEQAEPVEGAETEPAAGPSSGLMLLFEDRESEASADDALSDMAAAARGDDSAPAPDDALDQIAAASTPAEPTGRQVRAARFEASSRRVYAYNAKRLMIPLLVVVGVILLILSVVTLVVLIGGRSGDEGYAAAPTGLQAYGRYFVVVALPLGAILLMGAWLFYVEVKKADARNNGSPPA